jgi:hypothetical protein
MRATLIPHPSTPCDFIDSFEMVVQRSDARGIVVGYVVTGDVEKILLPSQQSSERTDRLWEHTCFEIFLKPDGSRSYMELNFSPSTQWAAYRFDDYRAGMKELSMSAPPKIFHDEGTAHVMDIEIALELKALRTLTDTDVKLGASAVIEDRQGRKFYWALRHPSSKPDFHHSDSFILTLPHAGLRP